MENKLYHIAQRGSHAGLAVPCTATKNCRIGGTHMSAQQAEIYNNNEMQKRDSELKQKYGMLSETTEKSYNEKYERIKDELQEMYPTLNKKQIDKAFDLSLEIYDEHHYSSDLLSRYNKFQTLKNVKDDGEVVISINPNKTIKDRVNEHLVEMRNMQIPKYKQLKENYVFNEDKSVKWNKEQVIKHNSVQKETYDKYINEKNNNTKILNNLLVFAVKNEYPEINTAQARYLANENSFIEDSNPYVNVLDFAYCMTEIDKNK